ncbi:MAG: GGDEF domain-containing protein [Oceanospirillaceae bacterium]|nr:GGDEF domain-containing protein [Oceanospirillaceae bacterium]
MSSFVVHYDDTLRPLVESLQCTLKEYLPGTLWAPVTKLEQVRPGGFALLNADHIRPDDLPLIAARRTLVLVKDWSLDLCNEWLNRGASACLSDENVEKLAAELLTQRRLQEAASAARGDGEILQAVIDAVPVPIFYKDEHHIYRGCNVAFHEFIGLPQEKVVGHSVFDVAPADLAQRYYEADETLLEQRGCQRYEAPVRYADGSFRDIEFHKAVFFKPDGRVGGQVGVMLDVTERNQLMHKLEKFSHTDPLTGTGNRREFDAVAHRELRRHRSKQMALSLLVMDVDHFKQINDTWGHPVGDQALRFLVDQCHSQLRENDRLFRAGGEEFFMVLPQTDVNQARSVADRLCAHMRKQVLRIDDAEIRMTVSIGVIELTRGASLEDALDLADQALYKAKREGRDRVSVAET